MPGKCSQNENTAHTTNRDRHTHKDGDNSSEYMANFTCLHHAPPDTGGNFYVSDIRTLVKAASNTLVVYKPIKHFHGTTLPRIVPRLNTDFGLYVAKRLTYAVERDRKLGLVREAIGLDRSRFTNEQKRDAAVQEEKEDAQLKSMGNFEDIGEVLVKEYFMNTTNTGGRKWLAPGETH